MIQVYKDKNSVNFLTYCLNNKTEFSSHNSDMAIWVWCWCCPPQTTPSYCTPWTNLRMCNFPPQVTTASSFAEETRDDELVFLKVEPDLIFSIVVSSLDRLNPCTLFIMGYQISLKLILKIWDFRIVWMYCVYKWITCNIWYRPKILLNDNLKTVIDTRWSMLDKCHGLR